MKVLERVIEGRVRKIVKIDDMQFGFMAGRSTTDAIFIVRQRKQEKYLARNNELWMAFVDLKKVFDRVPREVVWWALRYLGVDEWIVSVKKAMYEDATTKVKLHGRVMRRWTNRLVQPVGPTVGPTVASCERSSNRLVQPVGQIKHVKFIQPVEPTVASLKRSSNCRADSWTNYANEVPQSDSQ